jgi:hypothetical protein
VAWPIFGSMPVVSVAPGDRNALASMLVIVANNGSFFLSSFHSPPNMHSNEHGIPVMTRIDHFLRKGALLSSLQEGVRRLPFFQLIQQPLIAPRSTHPRHTFAFRGHRHLWKTGMASMAPMRICIQPQQADTCDTACSTPSKSSPEGLSVSSYPLNGANAKLLISNQGSVLRETGFSRLPIRTNGLAADTTGR